MLFWIFWTLVMFQDGRWRSCCISWNNDAECPIELGEDSVRPCFFGVILGELLLQGIERLFIGHIYQSILFDIFWVCCLCLWKFLCFVCVCGSSFVEDGLIS